MASALMRRSALTAVLAAAATVFSPLSGIANAAPGLTAPTMSPSNGGTNTTNQPQISATYNTALDASSTLTVKDTSAGNAVVDCPATVTGAQIKCTPSSSLVDGHSYQVASHGVNAADTSNTADGTATWTEDIPSEYAVSPAHNSTSAKVTKASAEFDETIFNGDYTVHVVNGKGHDIANSGSTSVSNGLDTDTGQQQGTITWTSSQPGGLPPSTYTVTFVVHGTTGTGIPSYGENTGASGTSVNTFTVDQTLPADAPYNVTPPANITQANVKAVPFSGYAPPGSNVAVAIYDETYDQSGPFGPNTEGTGGRDGLGTTVVPACSDAQAQTSANDVRLCPFSLTVDDSKSKDSSTGPTDVQNDQTGSPYNVSLQWYAYTFTSAGQKPAHACPKLDAANDCPGANPTIFKDTTPPSNPSGGDAHWTKATNTVDVKGATDNDATIDHYLVTVTDPEGHSTSAPSAASSTTGHAMSPVSVDVSSLDDGALSVVIAAVDSFGNTSSGTTASTTPQQITPGGVVTYTLTKESVATAPADPSADSLTSDGVSRGFSTLTTSNRLHTPTSVTVYFNEPIRMQAMDASGQNASSPKPLYTSEICLDDSTGPGSCLNHGLGTTTLTSDGKGLTWTAPANYVLPSDSYDVSAFAVAKTCADKTNANSNGYSCERSAQPGDALTHFTVDETPPTVSITSVTNPVDATNIQTVTIGGTASGDTTQVLLSVISSGGGSPRLALVDTTPTSDGSGTINWSKSLDLTSLPDGLLSISAVAKDQAGNVTPQSSEATATAPMQARPTAPQNLSAFGQNGQILVSWAPPANTGGHPLTGYTLSITDTTANGPAQTIQVAPTATSQLVSNLVNGHLYSILLTAANDIGAGPAANTSATPKGATGLSLSAPSVLTYGQSGTLRGKLTYLGTGIGNEKITITPYIGSKAGAAKTVTTDSLGNFALSVKPSRTTKYIASFAGDSAYGAATPASRLIKVRVAIKITKVSASSRSHLVTVTLTGYVKPNMHGRTVYIYEVIGGKNHKLAAVKLTSKSTWTYKRKFGKGKHTVFANFRTQNGYYGNNSSKVKFTRS